MDKEKVSSVLNAVKEGLPQCGEAVRGGIGSECCCPLIVVYLIETQCLNINNASCPDWRFCGNNIVG